MKKISKLTVITTLITLLPIVLGIALYDRLPEVVATHWNIHNLSLIHISEPTRH